ncbi:hypothetical protein S40288_11714 [Stachybotrys chartarum IBT 40288]|nr:hypothetical protein S40288_11714 [Stachybotrys chartarum IBT 40288]
MIIHSSVSTLIAVVNGGKASPGRLVELQTQAKKVIGSMKVKLGKAKQRNDDEVAAKEKHCSRCLAEAQVLVAIDQVNASRSIALSLQVLIDTYREGNGLDAILLDSLPRRLGPSSRSGIYMVGSFENAVSEQSDNESGDPDEEVDDEDGEEVTVVSDPAENAAGVDEIAMVEAMEAEHHASQQ